MIPRRSVQEIRARYTLEPNIKDIYVEGQFDKEVLSFHFNNDNGHQIYIIDTVDIGFNILNEMGLTEGNKQRVIALSKLIEDINHKENVHFLVDRDLDYWLETEINVKGLFFTKHCSLELYFYTEEIIKDIILICSEAKISDWDKFFSSLENTLMIFYSYRMARFIYNESLVMPDIDKCIQKINDTIEIDFSKFINLMFSRNGANDFGEAIKTQSEMWMDKLKTEPTMSINGHDFVDVLRWCISNFKGHKKFADNLFVERIMVVNAKKIADIASIFNKVKSEVRDLSPA
jgi:hypothetical protein